jgi:hypothetical protein
MFTLHSLLDIRCTLVTVHTSISNRKAVQLQLYNFIVYFFASPSEMVISVCEVGPLGNVVNATHLSVSLHSAEFKVYIAQLLRGLFEDDLDIRFQFYGAL